MGPRYHLVRAFVGDDARGNVAAVVSCGAPLADEVMQRIAADFNQSETAFVVDTGERITIRWFTPAREIDLCGHATLAAAAVLARGRGFGAAGALALAYAGGLIEVRRAGVGYAIDLPVRAASALGGLPPDVEAALGISARWVGRGVRDRLVEVETEKDVRRIVANERLLLGPCIVTARADEGRPYDFVSRYFDPVDGEDPVTGSAHATLGPFWSARLGRPTLVGKQLSARGGVIRVHVREEAVELAGEAEVFASGTLNDP